MCIATTGIQFHFFIEKLIPQRVMWESTDSAINLNVSVIYCLHSYVAKQHGTCLFTTAIMIVAHMLCNRHLWTHTQNVAEKWLGFTSLGGKSQFVDTMWFSVAALVNFIGIRFQYFFKVTFDFRLILFIIELNATTTKKSREHWTKISMTWLKEQKSRRVKKVWLVVVIIKSFHSINAVNPIKLILFQSVIEYQKWLNN